MFLSKIYAYIVMIIKLISCVNQPNLNKFITWSELHVDINIANACIHMRMRHEFRRERLYWSCYLSYIWFSDWIIWHVCISNVYFPRDRSSYDMPSYIVMAYVQLLTCYHTLRAVFITGTLLMFNSLGSCIINQFIPIDLTT